MKVSVATSNIKVDLTDTAKRRAGVLIAEYAPDFIGFQELIGTSAHQYMKAGLGKKYRFTDGTGNAIAFKRRKWKLVSHSKTLGTKGEAHVVPNLWIVVAVFKHRLKPWREVRIVNTQFPPLTLHGKPRANYVQMKSLWDKQYKIWSETLNYRDIPTYHTGDFNNINHTEKSLRVLVDNNLDKVYYVGNGTPIKDKRVILVRTPSDHVTRIAETKI